MPATRSSRFISMLPRNEYGGCSRTWSVESTVLRGGMARRCGGTGCFRCSVQGLEPVQIDALVGGLSGEDQQGRFAAEASQVTSPSACSR